MRNEKNMRKMKDSGIQWIGQIPENWSVTQLKRLSIIQTGNTPSKEANGEKIYYSSESGIPWIKAEDLGTTDNITTTKEYLSEEGTKLGRIFPCNTVYVCCIASVGKVGFSTLACSCNQQINGIVFNRLYWKYGFYMSLAQEEEYMLNASGNVMKIINTDKQSRLYCPVPNTLAEQTRIANFLDKKCSAIDSVLEKTKASIEEYKKLKQSVITQAVTKGIRPNRQMKDSGIEWIRQIPEDWKVIKFKYLAIVKSNLVEPSDYANYPQVSPENIEKSSGKLLPCKTVKEVGVISDNHLFYKGQILYSKIRPKLNKVTIAPFDGLCSADMYPIETTQHKKFFLYALLSGSFLTQISFITEDRVKMPKINQEELGNTIFPIPPKDEQQSIADYLDTKCTEIDNLIAKKEQFLKEIETYKKSLIYEYVTGKKEVL